MPNKNEVTIFLSAEEALAFKEFLRHKDKINVLLERGVFDVKNGSVVMDFDKHSQLQTIRFTGYMFSRRHELLDYSDPSSFKTL